MATVQFKTEDSAELELLQKINQAFRLRKGNGLDLCKVLKRDYFTMIKKLGSNFPIEVVVAICSRLKFVRSQKKIFHGWQYFGIISRCWFDPFLSLNDLMVLSIET